jgi:hypothetical protein
MGSFFFYNNRKPRKFNYTPILFNADEEERRERLQKRIENVKKEMGVLPETEEETAEKKEFKSEFISQTRHLKKRMEGDASGKTSFFANNGLLIILLIVLFAIFFFWLLG